MRLPWRSMRPPPPSPTGLILLCGLAASGCSPTRGPGSTPGADGGASDTGAGAGVQVAPTDRVPTVLQVSWTTPTPAIGQVEYGPDATYGAATPLETEPTTEHSALLYGMPAEAEVHLRVVSEADGARVLGDDVVAWTDPLRAAMAATSASGETDQFTVTTLLGTNWMPTIFDRQGRVVWSVSVDVNNGMLFRSRLGRDGQSILYGIDGVVGGQVVRVGWDGAEIEAIDAPAFSHDFVETDDGALAWLALDESEVDGELARGDTIVERSADGTERVVWSAWDSLIPGVVVDGDWTHGNVLEFDAARQVYQVSLRNLSLILEIDRASGDVLWSFGGDGASVTVDAASTAPTQQHGFELLSDDRLLVFDNGPIERAASAVREYQLDFGGGTASETWTHSLDPAIFGYALGDVAELPDGDVLIAWSSAGLLERVDRDGAASFQVQGSLGTGLGYITAIDLVAPDW